MAAVQRLSKPVVATVIDPVDPFKAGQQVEIDRVSQTCSLFGVQGTRVFIPPGKVNPEARQQIVRLHTATVNSR